MQIAIDFDATLVRADHDYDDLATPLELEPGALQALEALKRAGHRLILWSGRNNRARLYNPDLDPLVRNGVKLADPVRFQKNRDLEAARFWQMVNFVIEQLPGYFDAIDDGCQGKPAADLFIDDKAIRYDRLESNGGMNWFRIARVWGEPSDTIPGEVPR